MFNTFKIFPPRIQIFMYKRNRINTVLFHQWVCAFCNTMDIEFFFEKMVNSTIEIKGKSRRARSTKLVVNIKTPRTTDKKVYFGAREAPPWPAIVPVGFSMRFIKLRHTLVYHEVVERITQSIECKKKYNLFLIIRY